MPASKSRTSAQTSLSPSPQVITVDTLERITVILKLLTVLIIFVSSVSVTGYIAWKSKVDVENFKKLETEVQEQQKVITKLQRQLAVLEARSRRARAISTTESTAVEKGR